MDRYLMISSDCHAGAPWYVIGNYLDPKYREEYDRWADAYIAPLVNAGDKDASAYNRTLTSISAQRRAEYMAEMEKTKGHLGNWDPEIRARELDREGIAGEVIFPDGTQQNKPPFDVGITYRQGGRQPYELRLAGCRAHNRWLAEFCRANPGRHAGVAMITMDNPEDTVEDIRWARKNGLFGGVLLPGLELDTTGAENFWHHPRYEPVWQACEELQMPLNSHIGITGIVYGRPIQVEAYEKLVVAYRPFWFLLWGGVFRRHPGLKLCITEGGGLQVPGLNAYFDGYLSQERWPEAAREILGDMSPSEYWFRHCFVGASAHSGRREIDARHEIGVKNIMWGSDYPHAEGTWPRSAERTKTLFQGIPPEEVRLMLGGNAAKVYGFDEARLNALAERIGPKLDSFAG